MIFLTSEVPKEYEGNDEYFTADGVNFYYKIEFNQIDGDVIISDTCGRSIPIGVEELADVSAVLKRIVRYADEKKLADAWLLSGLTS